MLAQAWRGVLDVTDRADELELMRPLETNADDATMDDRVWGNGGEMSRDN